MMRQTVLLWAVVALLMLCSELPLSVADDSQTPFSTPTYYELLELPPSATAAELKRAYRRLALIHHPDKATSPTDRAAKEATFIALSNAHEVLSSDVLRPRYDHLLTEGIREYSDGVRDWAAFNPETGRFDRKRGEVVFGDGRFSFSGSRSWEDARGRWEREKGEEEREKRALLMALVASLGVALLPVGWFYLQRARVWLAERKRKEEASVKLRGEQAALAEWQQQRKREEDQRREGERARAAEIRRIREQQNAAAAAAEDDDDGAESEHASAEGAAAGAANATAGVAEGAVEDEEEEDLRPRKGGSGDGGGSDEVDVPLNCALCRKKFKSGPQLDNHLVSNAHKKAVKDAERRESKKK